MISAGSGRWQRKIQPTKWGKDILDHIFVADINHDGKKDIVFLYYNDSPSSLGVEVRSLISQGDGKWQQKLQQTTWGEGILKQVFVGDVDGNGNIDLVFTLPLLQCLIATQ